MPVSTLREVLSLPGAASSRHWSATSQTLGCVTQRAMLPPRVAASWIPGKAVALRVSISLPAGRRDDGTVEPEPEHGAVVRGGPVARDGTIGRRHPVTNPVGSGEDSGSGVEGILLAK